MDKKEEIVYHNRLVNYFSMIPFTAKLAWLVFGLAKIFGIFSVIFLFVPNKIYIIKFTLPCWIILLNVSVVLALYSRKHETELKEWWRYYQY